MKQSIVTFGELMLRLSPPDHKRIVQTDSFNIQFGGAEANVSVSLSNFNEPVSYITRLPETEIGKAALSSLAKYNVNTSESVFGGSRIGIYYLEAGASERGSKVIYDRAYSSMSEIKTGMIDWDRVFSNAKWFHWSGITPAISQNAADVCKEAIEAASKHGVMISADINYRKNLWQYGKKVSEVMPELLEGCDVIIGGQGDTKNVLGIDTDDSVNILHTCKRWQLRFPKLKRIFMSQR
ncbi:MAG: sugar kinase, partial [Cytophagales bacterium]|nr:sugar kinase [Cytophaga sp.]